MKPLHSLRRLLIGTGIACLLAAAHAADTQPARPRLIDLGADQCIPCRQMMPVLAELKAEYAGQFDVVFIDVWKDRVAGQPYGIRLIPTQIFFDATGKELFRHEGFYAKKDILAKWAELGLKLAPPAPGAGKVS